MNNCVALQNISQVQNCVDTDNRAGLVDRVLIGFAEDVGVWPDLPTPEGNDPLTLEEAGTWKGNLAMKTGCRMYEIEFTDETGYITITDQGEKGGESFLYEVNLVRAKFNAVQAGLENAIKGRNLVVVAQDRNGVKYLLGDQLAPATKVAGDGTTTGTTATDRNQTSLKFQYTGLRKLVYSGDLDSLLEEAGGGTAGGGGN